MTSRPVSLVCLALLCSATSAAEPVQIAVTDAVEMPTLVIVGTPQQEQKLPGSAQVIDSETLEKSHVYSTNEALRKVAGLNVRDEEGFGLRPNIGVRGLNPTRSTKILLLEDGIPLTFAPYGGNESYYHPPVERFDRIEVLKGAGQNIYGPQTVGGVINYITPAPPSDFGGRLSLAGGNRGYLNGRVSVGGEGLLFDVTGKESDGARDNIKSSIYDLNFKAVMDAGADHAFAFRANAYEEDSQVTYSGLTDAEFAKLGPRYNPFKNDTFDAVRYGTSVTHAWTFSSDADLTTNLYYNQFNRDWWRQASTTPSLTPPPDDPCGNVFGNNRLAGNAVNVDTDCLTTQGRLRDYYTYGIEPRLTLAYKALGLDNELKTGVRYHAESQERRQLNGTSPTARTGTLAENNQRLTDAYSGFVQNRFAGGKLAVTPALRVEHIRYERTNLANGSKGTKNLTELIPSLGSTYEIGTDTQVFAGVHRGFAPPRTEDIIGQSSGIGGTITTAVEVEAEDSRNYELGLRSRPAPWMSYEVTLFRNDFSRQIAVGSIAGGSTPLAQGETLYQGIELNGRLDGGRFMDSAHNPFLELAYTHLPKAESTKPLRCLVNNASCAGGLAGGVLTGSAAGNRLPYAPENTLTTTLGYSHSIGVEARMEAVYVGSQFSDFANTAVAASNGNGQSGKIASYTIWNTAVNYTIPQTSLTVFVTAKNLFDKVYITDRTRGIQVGSPRLVQGGVEYRF